ncbi:MAG TPA: hypothetical protein VFC78_09630 [Tepidisphaeraceae bacterium]|nr:hypothetical protein [Tepidisphaeraceae bacterium]
MSNQPLDYRTPDKPPEKWQRSPVIGGVIAGAMITVPMLIGSIMSGGLGHGHYVFARAAFPLPMLLSAATGGTIGLPSIILALTQFSIYIGFLAWSTGISFKCFLVTFLLIILIHLVAVAACFCGLFSNFS